MPVALRYDGGQPHAWGLSDLGSPAVWEAEAIDGLTETVMTRLLVEAAEARAVAIELAARLAVDRPDLPALVLALPFSLAAATIEEMLGAAPAARVAALDAWRVAALIGTDVLVLKGGEGGASIADLVSLWRRGDEVFGAVQG